MLALSEKRRVCKPLVSVEKHRSEESGVVAVVTEIAKLLEQFFDVQVVTEISTLQGGNTGATPSN